MSSNIDVQTDSEVVASHPLPELHRAPICETLASSMLTLAAIHLRRLGGVCSALAKGIH
jgi:hypothetical protein